MNPRVKPAHSLLTLSSSIFLLPPLHSPPPSTAESCAALRQTASTSTATQHPPPNSSHVLAKRKRTAEEEDDDDDGVPKRALPELMWPPDPLEEGLNALSDPLNRDEVKPLLHSELLAIGAFLPPLSTCSSFRQMQVS